MLPDDRRFKSALQGVAYRYMTRRNQSKEDAVAELKARAPGHEDEEYHHGFELGCSLHRIANDAVSEFIESQTGNIRHWDFSELDYDSCMRRMDALAPNYFDRNEKMGWVNLIVEIALR